MEGSRHYMHLKFVSSSPSLWDFTDITSSVKKLWPTSSDSIIILLLDLTKSHRARDIGHDSRCSKLALASFHVTVNNIQGKNEHYLGCELGWINKQISMNYYDEWRRIQLNLKNTLKFVNSSSFFRHLQYNLFTLYYSLLQQLLPIAPRTIKKGKYGFMWVSLWEGFVELESVKMALGHYSRL